MTTLLLDRDRRREIEHAASAQAAQFDWPVVVRHFEESLRETIEAARVAGQALGASRG